MAADVIATSRGYYGGILREVGDVFQAEGAASWWKPVGEATAAVVETVEKKRTRRTPQEDNEVKTSLSPEPDWVAPSQPDI